MYAQTFVSRNAATHKHISAICGGSSLQTTTGAVTCGQTTTAEIGIGAVTAMQKRKREKKKEKGVTRKMESCTNVIVNAFQCAIMEQEE